MVLSSVETPVHFAFKSSTGSPDLAFQLGHRQTHVQKPAAAADLHL